MSNIFKNNAYHILGLDTSANQKDILKRSKEIINRLKIDDMPEYEIDIGLFDNFRTEGATKEAIQKLQMPRKRIKEYFFWFQIADSVDEQALKLLKAKDYIKAIRVWQNATENSGTESYFYKKNLAILYCLLLTIKENKNYLQDSLLLWKELVEEDRFWLSFSKTYNLHDEQIANQELIIDFKNRVVNYLDDFYAELHQIHKNADYISQFQKVFSVKGERTEGILKPIYQAIHNAASDLEKMKVGEDGVIDKDKAQKIKKLIGIIQNELNRLIDLGLYDDSQTRIMRDMVANALRNLSIDLHNNLNETEIALSLAKIAEEISEMKSKSEIQDDITTFKGTLKYKEIVEKIKSGKSKEALKEIDHLLYDNGTDAKLKKILQELKQATEERIVKYGKPIGKAPSMSTINGIGTRVYGDTLYFVVLFIPVIPIARYSLENHVDGSYSFFGELELHKWQEYWQYILLGIFAIGISLPFIF